MSNNIQTERDRPQVSIMYDREARIRLDRSFQSAREDRLILEKK